MRIYLDSCCLNRPFDTLRDDIVRAEAEAVLTIVNRCEEGGWELLLSDVLIEEIKAIHNLAKRQKVLLLCRLARESIALSDEITIRANELVQSGIKFYDALHVASAEAGDVDVFLTTDRRLLNAAKRTEVKVNVSNPMTWLSEVLSDEHQSR